jgi:hypothetical protein
LEQEETNEANDSTSQTNMPIENTNVDDSGNDDIDIESPQQTLKNDIYKQESLRSIFDLKNLRVTSSFSLHSPKTCPICIETYKSGDDIVWSKNEGCFHAYHLECIEDWLMDKDDCPMCRRNYLVAE